MHQSKLFTLLRGLQPEEIHWLQKFLNSPFYNTNKLHIDLFDYIRKYYPDLDSPKLNKEAACKKMFPDETFNLQKLRKAMHGLTLLTEEFLVAMRLRNNAFQKKKILVEELGERNIYGPFEKGTMELIGELEALPYRDTFFYKNMHELNLNYFSHVLTSKQNLSNENLKSSLEYLDYYYLLQRQQLDCAIKGRGNIFADKHNINSLEQAKTVFREEPVFKLYELIFKALNGKNSIEDFSRLESFFIEKIEKLSKDDAITILRIILNFYSSQINKGLKGFHSKMLALFKFGLKQKLMIENGQMNGSIFGNIVAVGVIEKDFEWLEDFIGDYQKHLPDSEREDTTFLSRALVCFHKMEYSKSIDLISNHIFVMPLQVLTSKTILLRSYFEIFLSDKSYFELLIAQTQAFEKYVRRNEFISKTKKELYLNFILFTRKIAVAQLSNKLDANLLDSIKNTDSVVLKSWLLEKALGGF